MNYFKDLQGMIQRLHDCESSHLETVPVTEVFQGQVVWEGDVEVFRLLGHPKARKCFVWAHTTGEDDQGKRYVAVLALPPVKTPQDAVRAAIVDEYKKRKAK